MLLIRQIVLMGDHWTHRASLFKCPGLIKPSVPSLTDPLFLQMAHLKCSICDLRFMQDARGLAVPVSCRRCGMWGLVAACSTSEHLRPKGCIFCRLCLRNHLVSLPESTCPLCGCSLPSDEPLRIFFAVDSSDNTDEALSQQITE